jgi:regulator of protease activity HflC (stomatin/prohibitin superfamily)
MENALPCIIGLVAVLGVALLFLVLSGIKLLYQYERGVVFTLGKYTSTRDPGLTIVIPLYQAMRRVDMRIKTAEIPRQEVITKDNIPLLVNAVVYFRVINQDRGLCVCRAAVYSSGVAGCDRQCGA